MKKCVKEAYHRILLPDGQQVHGPVVVETDDNGRFLSWHIMQEEEAFTLWRGGTYNILEQNKSKT